MKKFCCPSESHGTLTSRFLISVVPTQIPDDDAAEGRTAHTGERTRDNDIDGNPRSFSGPRRNKLSKEEKKAKRGANKGRRFQKVRDEVELCWKIANGKECEFGSE